jgi:hypothetical protein
VRFAIGLDADCEKAMIAIRDPEIAVIRPD